MARFAFLTALLIAAIPLSTPVMAQDRGFEIGGDRFAAGRSVSVSDEGLGDVFAAGGRVTLGSDINGSAHLAGRTVDLDGRVGGNAYAAGMTVEVDGSVTGNGTFLGNNVEIGESVSGNLRAMGGDVVLDAPVAGSAILGGETVEVDGSIGGDLAISAGEVIWGEDARVAGTVRVYAEDPDDIAVPERVAPANQVEFRSIDRWEEEAGDAPVEERSVLARIGGLLGGIILTTLVAGIFAAVAPRFTQSLREGALAQPGRSLWLGALGLAAAIGSTVVVAMTGIGLLLTPFTMALAVLTGIAGYVIGAFLLGVWAVQAAGQGLPDSTADRIIAAFVGATLLTIVGLVPFVGWIAVVAVLLIGVGALVIRLFAPSFRQAV
ncbi:hypothetical protein [Maritimibacter sp. DP1N21-5]|uniref:hypothetical protein n=1 Tax=Maritimibacter sp. DP1N21-5 TaxID=2836867 RepID=UPI001C46783D|nr:hypothetical protein [Maritimibacter sp. DP1N21-5]MBV7410423.1 hypothetical protein [Maritimibacter sp. DP1N21-5]